ncbi:MAG: hypothetical protein LBQ13_02915 [Endomicrobium sp.]|jgi:hypothetical protein|nr:hypothetical protein [Endomicrobium sp.]
MKKIIIVLLCFASLSCASLVSHSAGFTQEDPAYKIIPKNPGENQALAIYYSPEFLRAKEDKKAATEMREPRYKGIPEFGYISIRIMAWTRGTAYTTDWLFIVQDGNKNEIYREYGTSSNPHGNINDVGNYYNTTWTNLHNIYLEKNEEFPLYLRAVTSDNKAIDIVIQKK